VNALVSLQAGAAVVEPPPEVLVAPLVVAPVAFEELPPLPPSLPVPVVLPALELLQPPIAALSAHTVNAIVLTAAAYTFMDFMIIVAPPSQC
jgi:hypothetical protein